MAVAQSTGGEQLAVWNQADGSDTRIMVAARRPPGRFGPATPVTPHGEFVTSPQVAYAGTTAVMTWNSGGKGSGEGVSVNARTRGPDGSMSPPQVISAEPASVLNAARVVGSPGSVLICWAEQVISGLPDNEKISYSARCVKWGAGRGFGSPHEINPVPDAPVVDAAADSQGNAVLTWSHDSEVYVADWPASSAAPGRARPLTVHGAPADGIAPSAGVDGAGHAYIAWLDVTPGLPISVALARVSSDGTARSTIVSSGDVSRETLDLAVAADGSALLIWGNGNPNGSFNPRAPRTRVAAVTPSGRVVRKQLLPGTEGSSSRPATLVATDGSPGLVWSGTAIAWAACSTRRGCGSRQVLVPAPRESGGVLYSGLVARGRRATLLWLTAPPPEPESGMTPGLFPPRPYGDPLRWSDVVLPPS